VNCGGTADHTILECTAPKRLSPPTAYPRVWDTFVTDGKNMACENIQDDVHILLIIQVKVKLSLCLTKHHAMKTY
jgi:hypothetical protein